MFGDEIEDTLLGVNRLISVYRWTRPEVDQGSFSSFSFEYRRFFHDEFIVETERKKVHSG